MAIEVRNEDAEGFNGCRCIACGEGCKVWAVFKAPPRECWVCVPCLRFALEKCEESVPPDPEPPITMDEFLTANDDPNDPVDVAF